MKLLRPADEYWYFVNAVAVFRIKDTLVKVIFSTDRGWQLSPSDCKTIT